MEQQKVLWIIFSVTLFILVVVVVGFVWFLPKEDARSTGSEPAVEAEESSITLDPFLWVRDAEEVPGLTKEPEGDTAGDGEIGDLLLLYGEADEESDGVDYPVVVSEEVEIASTVRVVAVPQAVSAPVRISPARTPRTAPAESEVGRPRQTVPSPSTNLKPKAVRVTQYWIQAGSFRSEFRAEENQARLADRGWITRIISRDIHGETYFRVRLGPLWTEAEAAKFLGWIKGIESFESSYISQVYTTRTIN